MGKFDRLGKKDAAKLRDEMQRAVTPAVGRIGTGPLKTKKTATTTTHEGAPAFEPKLKTELFQLAVSNMVGERTFYEKADARDTRFTDLVHRVAVKDPAWMLGFIGFLRGTANMRTASVVAAAEAVKARLAAGVSGVNETTSNRSIIDAALQRADEPGELLAYWLANHGRNVPKPVKRGLADAARRMYSQYTLLRYDTASHAIRFGDVIELVHPTPATPEQGELFKLAIDRRHGREGVTTLDRVAARAELQTLAPDARHAFMRRVQAGDAEAGRKFEAAMASQWEWAKSWLGG